MVKECKFTLTTSTASVCIFDPECLSHRVDNQPDWWSDFMEEIDEINKGNVMIVGLGVDGTYEATVDGANDDSCESVTALVRCRSGCFFVGPGEEITGGGFEPATLNNRTGIFVDLTPSTYRVTVAKRHSNQISIGFELEDGDASNCVEDQLLLEG